MAIVLALAAALSYGVASVLQQRAAREAPGEESLRLGLLWRLVRRPMWLAGTAVDWLAFAFQAAALGMGSLLVVQPVLCAGLLFALPLGAALSHRRLTTSDWAWALILAGALVVFLVVGDPNPGKQRAPGGEWLVAGVIGLVLVGGTTLAATRARGTRRALLLATATALLYAYTGGLTKSSVDLLGDGLHVFLTSWEPYVAAVAAVIGLLLNQSAFQAGELEASLPALTVVEPLGAAVLGAALLDERLRAEGTLEWLLVGLSVVAMIAAVLALARSAAEVEELLSAPHGETRAPGP